MNTKTTPFYRTSMGKKVVMAVSGVVVFGFLVIHIVGNLQLFLGADVFNSYAAMLQNLGGIKWIVRGGVLISLVVHIVASVQVTRQSMQARPVGYARIHYDTTTYAARTMRVGGPLIGLFLVYHLLHLTTGHLHSLGDRFGHGSIDCPDVYHNVVVGFSQPWVAGVYIVAMGVVGLHLYHGLWSMLQTVGISHPRWNHVRRWVAATFAVFIGVSGISLPVAVLLGVIEAV